MSVQALHTTATARPAGLLGRPGATAALLLAPCLIWIFAFFLLPLGLMCWRSVASEGFSLAPYATLFTSPLYIKVMLTSLKIVTLTTVATLLLGYPVAYALTISNGWTRIAILTLVTIPYWVDVIVRSFSWLIVLGDNGIVNRAMVGIGLISAPVPLLYNLVSVLLGMIQILLPMMIITLFAAMLRM